MPRTRSALVVRHGEVVIHVNEVALLLAVLESLGQSSERDVGPPSVAALAEVADTVLCAGAAAWPGHKFRGIRDIIYVGRGTLSSSDKAFLTQLNAAYGMLRHMSIGCIKHRAT